MKQSSTPSLFNTETPVTKLNRPSNLGDFSRTDNRLSKTKFLNYGAEIVPETRSVAEDDDHIDKVAEFLENLERDGPTQFKTIDHSSKKHNGPNIKDKELMMAHN